jgi:hypothetical protein
VPTPQGPALVKYDALQPGKSWLEIESPAPVSLDMRGLNGDAAECLEQSHLLPHGRHHVALAPRRPMRARVCYSWGERPGEDGAPHQRAQQDHATPTIRRLINRESK